MVGIAVAMRAVIMMVQSVTVTVTVAVAVVVGVTVTGQFEHEEADPGGDQDAADHRVLRVLDRRAQLQSDHDDHAAEPDRDQHVRDSGQSRKACDPRERVAARAAKHSERHPVVGQDRVPESDTRRGGEQRWPSTTHAV